MNTNTRRHFNSNSHQHNGFYLQKNLSNPIQIPRISPHQDSLSIGKSSKILQSRLQRPLLQISRIPQNHQMMLLPNRTNMSFHQQSFSPNQTKILGNRNRKTVISRHSSYQKLVSSLLKEESILKVRGRPSQNQEIKSISQNPEQIKAYQELLKTRRIQTETLHLQKAENYQEIKEMTIFKNKRIENKSPTYSDEESWKSQTFDAKVEESVSKSSQNQSQTSELGQIPFQHLPAKAIEIVTSNNKIKTLEDKFIEIKKRLKVKALKATKTKTLKISNSDYQNQKISSNKSSPKTDKSNLHDEKKENSVFENNLEEFESEFRNSEGISDLKKRSKTDKIITYHELKPNRCSSQTGDFSENGTGLSNMIAKQYRINHEKQKRILSKLNSSFQTKEIIHNVLRNEESEYLCHQMCSEQETNDRHQAGEIDNYETPKMQIDLKPIKKFKRSAADTQLNDVHYIRPPFILLKTVNFIIKNVLSFVDQQSIDEIFDFVDDRFRAVCQDFTIIFGEKDRSLSIAVELFRSSKESILSYEAMVRFYITILNDMRFRKEIDEHKVLKPLSGILTTLIENYLEAKKMQNQFLDELRLCN